MGMMWARILIPVALTLAAGVVLATQPKAKAKHELVLTCDKGNPTPGCPLTAQFDTRGACLDFKQRVQFIVMHAAKPKPDELVTLLKRLDATMSCRER